jgi:hypothetical protein
MTDPNLRRLLDVAMRKNPERHTNHYVFKLKYDPEYLEQRVSEIGIAANEAGGASDFIKISEMLEEQDGSNLGLNTIWIDDYAEIPGLLARIASERKQDDL